MTMQMQLEGIACRRLFTPRDILDNVLVLFEEGRIGGMGEFASSWIAPGIFNAREEEWVVVPGLVDTHVHGSNGADFFTPTGEGLERISASVARGGATSVVCSTAIPADDAELEGLAELVRLVRQTNPPGARFLGIFLEGPFINPQKRGGFGRRYLQPVDLKRAEKILSVCGDTLLKITLAPELEGAEALVRLLSEDPRTRVEISLGHTAADDALARRFFAMERVRQVTHAFNAMNPLHHRAPNLIGAALVDPNVTLEMIPDGQHLAAAVIALLHRVKGPRRLMIVTDGTAITATPPGTKIHDVGGVVEVRDGAVRLGDGTIAGSNVLMADALRLAQRLGAIDFVDCVEMATLTPAASVHREDEIGSIEPRKRADFCVLRKDGSVVATIRDGVLVYSGEETL
jgi:N-acetylglucosamine-6-phosphate deacetylase